MIKTTLCYIRMGNKLLMLCRNKKKKDENANKYIGLGGHFLEGETPEECILREVREESGIELTGYRYCGIVTFHSNVFPSEEMHLFSAVAPIVPLPECDEGTLCLLEEQELLSLPMWEGDRIFLSLILDKKEVPFFHLTLRYEGETLKEAILDGKAVQPPSNSII